uniref:Uncharacterized protein n=1 Tax=Arundo donax TaxID=35708 RepID=A0A0A9BS62_ARUDO
MVMLVLVSLMLVYSSRENMNIYILFR